MPAYVEIFDLINRILNNLVGTLAQRKSEKYCGGNSITT